MVDVAYRRGMGDGSGFGNVDAACFRVRALHHSIDNNMRLAVRYANAVPMPCEIQKNTLRYFVGGGSRGLRARYVYGVYGVRLLQTADEF